MTDAVDQQSSDAGTRLNPADNVAVCTRKLEAGAQDNGVTVCDAIPRGHKFALSAIAVGRTEGTSDLLHGFFLNVQTIILGTVVVFEIAGLSVDDPVEELGRTVGEALLEPTRIYARAVRGVLAYYRVKSVVHGIAHVTGGGLHENLERILPEGTRR